VIITLPGWAGRFDVDFDFRPGSPASYGPNGGDPGDPAELEIELVVWEFSPYDCIALSPKQVGDDLYQALLAYGYENSKPEDWVSDDSEFFDMQVAP
jgi:hypothetical protein